MLSLKIKKLRQSASLTQEEMSKILGCSVATVCGYETGKVNVPYDAAKIYAQYFKCPAEYLLSDEMPLMDDPSALHQKPYSSKLAVSKNLALPPAGNNVYSLHDEINHPFFDNPVGRKAWLKSQKDGWAEIAIVTEVSAFREGDFVAVVLDGKTTAGGYYYVDEQRRVCIKTKPKGNKGIRNIRVGLCENDEIIGIIDSVIMVKE